MRIAGAMHKVKLRDIVQIALTEHRRIKSSYTVLVTKKFADEFSLSIYQFNGGSAEYTRLYRGMSDVNPGVRGAFHNVFAQYICAYCANESCFRSVLPGKICYIKGIASGICGLFIDIIIYAAIAKTQNFQFIPPYPFTLPCERPLINCLWNMRNNMIITDADIVRPAISTG